METLDIIKMTTVTVTIMINDNLRMLEMENRWMRLNGLPVSRRSCLRQ